MKPLNDRIIASPLKDEGQITAGGITISTQSTIKKAKVIAVGEGTYENGNLVSLKTKVGDTIAYFGGHAYSFLNDGQEFVVLRESDVLFLV